MENDGERERKRKAEQQREARRRRILSNAGSRMDKIRGITRPTSETSEASTGDVHETPTEDHEPAPDPLPAPDPPDEVLPSPLPTERPPTTLQPPRISLLGRTVTTVQGGVAYGIRTTAAILCGLAIAVWNFTGSPPMSCVVALVCVDAGVFTVLTAASVATGRNSNTMPLGKLELLRIMLLYVQPMLASTFETAVLAVYLVGSLLRDICITVFVTVTSVALMVYVPMFV